MIFSKILAALKVRRVSQKCFHRRISNLRVLYFGTDLFSVQSLDALCQLNLPRLEVVTSYRAVNNPIKSLAQKKELKLYDWKLISQGENYKVCEEFDLGIVVSFGHLIPERFINSFSRGIINVHASLLPKYRGASPIIHAIKNGDKETGVTIMQIKPKKFDTGEILMAKKFSIPENVLMPELNETLAKAGADLLVEYLKSMNQPHEAIPQDESAACYAPKITNEFCEVRWTEMTSTDVYNLYRALYSFKPLETTYRGERVKMFELCKAVDFQPAPEVADAEPGSISYCKAAKTLFVKCQDSCFVGVKKLSIGKKKMSAADFHNGFLSKVESSEKIFKSDLKSE